MKAVKIIRDPIHGNIRLNQLELDLLDTPQMQRLRRIKQNGLCHIVYPAMHSSRFEHSLGVLHLASVMSDHLSLREGESLPLRVAALLHDVGHCAFSHTTDELLSEMGHTHEKISCDVIRNSEVTHILEKYDVRPSLVADFVSGKRELGKIISSEIDLDRMDYLVRDSYYAGVAYGVIDVERIISGMRIKNRRLVVDYSSLEAVELLLISRNMMYETVYRHHTKRIAEFMLRHALAYAYESGELLFEKFRYMDDVDVISLLRCFGGYPTDIISRLDERRLFKTFSSVKASDLGSRVIRKLRKDHLKIEGEIGTDFNIEKGYVLLDYPEEKSSEFKIKIDVDGELKSIKEVSYLARSLERSEKEKIMVSLHAPQEMGKKLKEVKLKDHIN